MEVLAKGLDGAAKLLLECFGAATAHAKASGHKDPLGGLGIRTDGVRLQVQSMAAVDVTTNRALVSLVVSSDDAAGVVS